MSLRILSAAGLFALLAPLATASAQSDDDLAAYLAIVWTPVGALPPIAHGSDVGAPFGLALRYGRLANASEGTFDNVGLTLDLPIAEGARTSVTLARNDNDCATCDPAIAAAADVELPLRSWSRPAGEVTVSFKPSAGYALGMGDLDFSMISAAVGFPLALRTNGALSVMPYLVPSAAYGLTSGTGDSSGGVRAMLGGGVRLQSARTGFGGVAGFQKVFISGGGTLVGLGLTWGGSR